MTTTEPDPVAGVTIFFGPDGPDMEEMTRRNALAGLFAFELALIADDPAQIVEICKAMYAGEAGSDPMVTRQALMFLLTSVVRPALTLLGDQADPLRTVLRGCADHFDSVLN